MGGEEDIEGHNSQFYRNPRIGFRGDDRTFGTLSFGFDKQHMHQSPWATSFSFGDLLPFCSALSLGTAECRDRDSEPFQASSC